MVKRVQIAGGPAETQNALIGLEREITAVTDSHELRLHDATKVGGHRFLPKALNDLLYQPVSAELLALAQLGQLKGLMVRTGAETYVARQVLGTANEIVVTNNDGFSGNITVGLPSAIDKAGLSFVQSVGFSNGIVGDLTGNVTGDVTGNLEGDANGNHTGVFTGDVDVQGQSLLLDDGQIPIAKLAQVPLLEGDDRIFPAGGIIMWSGAEGAIPAGWVLCDGTNGTPDLRDRFIIGAASTGAFAIDDTGGSDSHAHTGSSASAGDHNHDITVNPHALTVDEMPTHDHGSGYGTNKAEVALHGSRSITGTDRFDNNTSNPTLEAMTDEVGGGLGHSHTASSTTTGAHTHGVTVATTQTLPPYYALAFIMKT